MKFVLDTDICGFVQQAHPTVMSHFNALPADASVVTTIITVGESLSGWLSVCRRAGNGAVRAQAYARLQKAFDFYCQRPCLPFDEAAAEVFDQLTKQRLRIGTNDLAIASIALSVGGVLVTRNVADFQRVPGLIIEDWIR
ncbi:MAG TPA: type II toxin-antitoxin system VapC family toxin [Blastocatellia bacterium]|jgi:tRNA(fMet)-specific endonuclease VapC